jgi:hypothetical protein
MHTRTATYPRGFPGVELAIDARCFSGTLEIIPELLALSLMVFSGDRV